MNLGLGLSLAESWRSPSYDPAAEALFARFTTPPTDTRKGLINDLIVSLKDAGVWQKLDALYILAAADAQAARRNWIADQYNPSAVNSPTFTADRGYVGGGSGYLDTGFNASTAGGLYTQNSAHLSTWSRTNRGSTGISALGVRNSAGSVFAAIVPFVSSTTLYRINSAAASSVVAASSVGHFLGSRVSSGTIEAYKDGVSAGSISIASGALVNANVFICGENREGVGLVSGSTDQIAQVSIGGDLTAANAEALYTATLTYLQAIGAA